MITEALLHCPQIGPARLAQLRDRGIRSWDDVIARANELSDGIRTPIVEEINRCIVALETNDIGYFVNNLVTRDRWRVLTHFLDEVSFFDIETAGLEYDAPITVIACWHRGEVHSFVEHENLDDFLDLLDDVKLLSSFNGSTFDVPRVLDSFHIPALPCPHLDLRWLCYHQGMRGGLKEITSRLGVTRPTDLQNADGEMAIRLWSRWAHCRDHQAREALIRYCASDVLLLVVLSERLAGRTSSSYVERWQKLPFSNQAVKSQSQDRRTIPVNAFGDGSPATLRGRKRRTG